MTKYVVVHPRTKEVMGEYKRYNSAYTMAVKLSADIHMAVEICRIPTPYVQRRMVLHLS